MITFWNPKPFEKLLKAIYQFTFSGCFLISTPDICFDAKDGYSYCWCRYFVNIIFFIILDLETMIWDMLILITISFTAQKTSATTALPWPPRLFSLFYLFYSRTSPPCRSCDPSPVMVIFLIFKIFSIFSLCCNCLKIL